MGGQPGDCVDSNTFTLPNHLTFAIDTPCNDSNGKMPVLDVEVGINEKECNRIDDEFYEKTTKNQKVILSGSALSAALKSTISNKECHRRMGIELAAEVRKLERNYDPVRRLWKKCDL